MIPAITSNANLQKVVISTGNVLSANFKPGRKSNEELIDGLKLTLDGNETANHVELKTLEVQVLRGTQELNEKLTENERSEISIGAKIFLNKNCSVCIEQAVNAMLRILNMQYVDNVVLAYHPQPGVINLNSSPTIPNASKAANTIKCTGRNEHTVEELKELWKSLEEFALEKQITELGISDLDIQALSELHDAARVLPTIAQVNLASCCEVPPALQDFCTKHDIRLLTHSDPEILLADGVFIIPGYSVDWTLRYQAHIPFRGVLLAKGYILGASKKPAV